LEKVEELKQKLKAAQEELTKLASENLRNKERKKELKELKSVLKWKLENLADGLKELNAKHANFLLTPAKKGMSQHKM